MKEIGGSGRRYTGSRVLRMARGNTRGRDGRSLAVRWAIYSAWCSSRSFQCYPGGVGRSISGLGLAFGARLRPVFGLGCKFHCRTGAWFCLGEQEVLLDGYLVDLCFFI